MSKAREYPHYCECGKLISRAPTNPTYLVCRDCYASYKYLDELTELMELVKRVDTLGAKAFIAKHQDKSGFRTGEIIASLTTDLEAANQRVAEADKLCMDKHKLITKLSKNKKKLTAEIKRLELSYCDSETKINEQADEIQRLRDAIDDAPHDRWCMSLSQINDSECSSDCWKAALKEQDNG